MAKDLDSRKLSALDRLIETAMGEHRSFGLLDDPAAKKWPELWTLLSTIYVGRDKLKQPASLAISLVPGGVSIRVTDRDIRHSVEVVVPHLASAFDLLESVLAGPNPPWKAWGKGEPELRKRKTRN